MSEEVVTQDQITIPMLKSLFDAAFMETSIDSDGDLYVKGDTGCYVMPTKSKDRIHLLAQFRADEKSSKQARMELANRINYEMSTVRAYLNDKGNLVFDYYIPVEGGITKKAIVLATRFFLSVVVSSIRQYDSDNVVL
jgi:hypothetical protein